MEYTINLIDTPANIVAELKRRSETLNEPALKHVIGMIEEYIDIQDVLIRLLMNGRGMDGLQSLRKWDVSIEYFNYQ